MLSHSFNQGVEESRVEADGALQAENKTNTPKAQEKNTPYSCIFLFNPADFRLNSNMIP
jgi:hypothetical protein